MRNIWTIAKREYNTYFNSPLAYVVMLILFGVIGIIFALNLASVTQNPFFAQPLDPTLVSGPMAFMMLFCTPALTMRLISEESRSGTLELMLTAPIRDWELVTGKWMGAFLFMLTVIAMTLVFPIMINGMTDPGIDLAKTATAYLGMILLIGAFLGIGVGISALFKNQFAAFFATLGVLVIMWFLIGAPASFLPSGGEFFSYIDMRSHFVGGFARGSIELTDVLYYISVTAFGLFIGNVAVDYRRWQ